MNTKFLFSIKPAIIASICLYGLLLWFLYHSAFVFMFRQWDRAEYNYCYFIPFVVLYLIWDRREKVAALPSNPSWNGLLLVMLGIAFFWMGELGGEYLTLYVSFWLVLVGLCWVHLGWDKLKSIAFALFMCLTMFPLPNFLYNKISLKLQLISSQVGVSLMRIYGMSVHREGNIIDLAFGKLQVVEACSGLRSLMSLTVLGLLMTYFFRAVFWKRAVLLISVVPLSIIANSIRLSLTGILYEKLGREAAEGFFHGFSGWVVFCIAFGVLLLEMRILGTSDKLQPVKTDTVQRQNHDIPNAMGFDGSWQKGLQVFFHRQGIVAVAVILSTLALSHGIEFREKIPITTPLDQFPDRIGEWSGTKQTMAQQFIDALDLSDYAMIDYRNPEGATINMYIAYYESQRKGESIHTPETCLPGSGWDFQNAGTTSVLQEDNLQHPVRVNRAVMEKPGQQQLVYYWFPQRGRVLTNAYQLKWYAFWDALTRQRTDGALVRLITPVADSEELKHADARLQEFIRFIMPVLAETIPGERIE